MPALRIHTHCQVAQKANAQTKTCQRVWPPKRTGKLPTQIKQKTEQLMNVSA